MWECVREHAVHLVVVIILNILVLLWAMILWPYQVGYLMLMLLFHAASCLGYAGLKRMRFEYQRSKIETMAAIGVVASLIITMIAAFLAFHTGRYAMEHGGCAAVIVFVGICIIWFPINSAGDKYHEHAT